MSSPPGPSRLHPKRKPAVPHGFLAAPKPHVRNIQKMSVRELRDQHAKNAKILSEPGASTSSYAQRISTEQAAIESRLVDLVGVDAIRTQLQQTKIGDGEDAQSEGASPTPQPRPIAAKRNALAKAAARANNNYGNNTMSMEDAMRIEQEAHVRNVQREQDMLNRKRRQGLPTGQKETRAQLEARMWAFMSYKPTDSDMEDDDDDEDDISTWYVDDQDDGRKGQDIIEPDEEELSKIIRIDESRISSYSEFS